MKSYDLSFAEITSNANRFLSYVYATAYQDENPEVQFIVGGPGAGKSGIESYLRNRFREDGRKCIAIGSDKIAEFHPNYEEIIEELPEVCYRETRKFVKPATEIIFKELRDKKINLLNEKTFNKGEKDIQFVKDFKDVGYKVYINIIATDIFISRLACYERESRMLLNGDTPRGISKETQQQMYNSFIQEVEELMNLNYCDGVNIYTRGENINKPNLVYKNGGNQYSSFKEAIIVERKKQRDEILRNPAEYLDRIKKIKKSIKKNGVNELLTENAINGLEELQEDFIKELSYEYEER